MKELLNISKDTEKALVFVLVWVAYVNLGGLSCHDGTCEIVDSNIEIPESSYFAIFFGK